MELEAEYALKLGNRPRADVTLELLRSGGSPALAMEVVEAAAGKWGGLVVDNGEGSGVFTVDELQRRGKRNVVLGLGVGLEGGLGLGLTMTAVVGAL